MKNVLVFIALFILVFSVKGQEYKFLKPDFDDSCTVIKHILEEENRQEYIVYLDRKKWSEDKQALADFDYEESNYTELRGVYKGLLSEQVINT